MTATASNRHLPWELFERLIDSGKPAVEVVGGVPRVEIFTDAGGARIGVRTPTNGSDAPPSQLVEIDVSSRRIGEVQYLEVSTTNEALYADFYAFACAVADRIQLQQLPAQTAVDDALQAWSSLLQQVSLLNVERQIGLMGELWLLKRLSATVGWRSAIESWKGPSAEEHDFSLETVDIEVKTTLSESRAHMIGSLTQLVPTNDRPLYVLSLQFTGAGLGPGASLSEMVADIRQSVEQQSSESALALNSKLENLRWRDDHALHYRSRFTLRTPAALIPVDDQFPAITPDSLSALGPDKRARVLQVAYRVDLSDLGHTDGGSEFNNALGEEGYR